MNRAPSSMSSAASSSASPSSADASSTRPFRNVRRMEETAAVPSSVGTFNRIVPSAESSIGEKKNSPPGMFTWPSSTSPLPPLQRQAEVRFRADDPNLVSRIEPVAVAPHPLAFGIPVAQARSVKPILERAQRHARLLGERVRRELAADPRDLVGHRPPEERRLRDVHQGTPFGGDLRLAARVVGRLDRDPRVHVVGGVEVDRRHLADELGRRLRRPDVVDGKSVQFIRRSGYAPASRSAGSAPRPAGRASGCVRISTCQPGCTPSDRSTSSCAYSATWV